MAATDLTIRIGAALSKTFSASFGAAEERASGMGKAYAKVNKELSDVRSVRRYQRELDRLRRDGRGATQTEDAFQRQLRETEKALDRAQRKVKGYGHSLDDLSRLDRRLATRRYLSGVGARAQDRLPMLRNAGYAVGGAAVAGVTGGYMLTQNTASSLESAGRFAERTRMTPQAVQEMDFVAKQNNLEPERMRDALQEQSVRLGEALRGEGEALPALQALNIDPKSLADLSPDRQMERLADALAAVPNQNIRLSLADQLYGDPGQELLQLLQQGGGALRDSRDLGRQTGNVFGEQDTRNAYAFNSALDQSRARLAGLSGMVGTALMPEFTQLFQSFSRWFDSQDDLRGQIGEWRDGLKEVLTETRALGEGFMSVAVPVGEAIGGIVDGMGGWENAGKLLAGLMAGRLLGAVLGVNAAVGGLVKLGLGKTLMGGARGSGRLLRSLGSLVPTLGNLRGMAVATTLNMGMMGDKAKGAGGLFKSLGGVLSGALAKGIGVARLAVVGFGRALLMNPIGLMIGGIATAAYLIYENWGPIGRWFSRLWESVTSIFSRAWEGITGILDSVMARAKTAIENPWETIKTIFEWSPVGLVWKAWSALFSLPGRLLDKLGENFTTAFPDLSSTISDQFSGVFDIASGWYDKIADKFSGIGDLWDQAVNFVTGEDEEGSDAPSVIMGRGARRHSSEMAAQLETATTGAQTNVNSNYTNHNSVSVTVQVPEGMDEERVARLIGERVPQALDEHERRKSEERGSALYDLAT